jgi:hypothetical protein
MASQGDVLTLHMRAKVLRRAAELIELPDAWIQGASVADESGQTLWCEFGSPRAAKWCAAGAINTAGHQIGVDLATIDAALMALLRSLGGSILEFNDAPERTADEVAAALRAAADRCDGVSTEQSEAS